MNKTFVIAISIFSVLFLDSQTNSRTRLQRGYYKPSSQTFVQPHYKTNVNTTNWDNFSTQGNYNPTNSSNGSRARDFSTEALNYGNGQVIHHGSNGGQYYYNSNGNKVYVPKRR
jgi:hypothetical protein